MANKAREALSKVDGIESVVVDTTSRAIFRTTKNARPSEKALKLALKGMHMKVRKLQKRKIPVAAAVYQVQIKGVG